MTKPLPDKKIEELEGLYRRGIKLDALAVEFGLSKSGVHRIAKKRGWPLRKQEIRK